MQKSVQTIGVFDSGVGGLSVLKAIVQQLPNASCIYLADSAHAPYGDRSEDYIQQRVLALSRYLIAQPVDAIVVACNTATSVAVSALRREVSIPVIAIEPPIKPACEQSRAGKVGVMATTRTVNSDNVKKLVTHFAGRCQVFLQACPGLVAQIEAGEMDSVKTRTLLHEFIDPLLAHGIDTLVLGCTHYPFLHQPIQQMVGPSVQLLEPAQAVARELARRLGLATGAQLDKVDEQVELRDLATIAFFSNGDLAVAQTVIARLWGSPVSVASF